MNDNIIIWIVVFLVMCIIYIYVCNILSKFEEYYMTIYCMLPITKIYIDNNDKTPDSVSHTDFKIELPMNISLPSNNVYISQIFYFCKFLHC